MTTERNWAGNLTYRASTIARPESIDDLSALLAAGGPVRLLGSRHCFNDIADTDGTLVALDRLPSVFEVDPTRTSVRVSAAARYGDIAPRLEAEGLGLANLASLAQIWGGGGIGTGRDG